MAYDKTGDYEYTVNKNRNPHPAQRLKQQGPESVWAFNQVFLQLLIVQRGQHWHLLGSPED